MSDCFTGRLKEDVPPSIEAFGKVLADKPNLKIIDFSDNAFSPAGATALSYFLANCITLEELRLNNNGLGPEGGKIIANGLKQNRIKSRESGKPSQLRRVTIGRNRLENGSAFELSEAFSLHENLEDVALFQNGIRPEGIVLLSEGLSKCSKLSSIDLQDNTFKFNGSKAFSMAIPNWNELTLLNIGDCLLSDAGCKVIIEKLLTSPSISKLKILNLQYAEMESETVKLLANNLGKFCSLEKLFLNGNLFPPEGKEVEAIRSSLLPTTTLDELDDMEYDESEESEGSEESDLESISKVDNIPSTPSPKPAVDEVADVTEIIGTMAIKETEEMIPEPIEEVILAATENIQITESDPINEDTTEITETIEITEATNATEAIEVTETVSENTEDAFITETPIEVDIVNICEPVESQVLISENESEESIAATEEKTEN